MEDYDKFVQRRLSHLRKSEEENVKASPASSVIRFNGHPVLPPLLSGEQREEMRRHREAAQKAAVLRTLKDDLRMAYVQTILHSVQLRKTPTLEELLQESESHPASSCSHNASGGSVSQSNDITGTKDSLWLSPHAERKEKDGVPLIPLTSTTNSAFFAPNVTPQQSHQGGSLIDQHHCQQTSQPGSFNGASHQSSGYVTYENFEIPAIVSEGTDVEGESEGSCSVPEAACDMAGFFLHSTSNTIAKMPDIISHPPIDGEELERSGLETSLCDDFIVVKDMFCPLLQEDWLPVEQSESSSHLDSTGGEDNLSVSTILDLDKDDDLDRMEGPVSWSGNNMSDHPELSQTLSTQNCQTTGVHSQHSRAETEPEGDHLEEEESSEEPYRLSLQALLKKSQEYRRRQRMLRNQAKNTKIQERTHEQPRARAAGEEEQSHSDKENDEFPHKGTVTAEGKRAKERRGGGTLNLSVATSPKKTWENQGTIEFLGNKGDFKSKPDGTHLTRDVNTKDMTSDEEETTFRNNQLNVSNEVITEPKQISPSPRQQPTMATESSPVEIALFTCPTASGTEGGKFQIFPAPNFCTSPVRCKSKGSFQDGDAVEEAETSKSNTLTNAGLIGDHAVAEVDVGHDDSPTSVPSTVSLGLDGDVTSGAAKSSQHIDQLESNLSGLKVLISDLQSTLAENFRNQSLTESDAPSDDNDEDQRHREWQTRQSSDNVKNMQQDRGPRSSNSDMDEVSLMALVKGTEAVNIDELRLVKTLATVRGKPKGTRKDGLSKSTGHQGGCRKQQQQPSAKCVLSVAQRRRIPDVFRNAPSETPAPCNVSVLSDASNSASLNQSYDVDAPSGLWLLEGSGSEWGSGGRLVMEDHVTPESGAEGQGGLARVKRRLLMHGTEETWERSADASGGGDSMVRPNSSTPKAAVRRHESHGSPKDKQEQLKQAHAAQIRALQEEHSRQQEELLKALAARYGLLQSVSLPLPMSGSRLGATLTSSALSQPCSPLSERYRPLVSAAAKGFLTRRLLRTERVAQLVRTIRDTQQLLQALHKQQSPGRGDFLSRQDSLLRERVTLQLRATRYEVHDIFFSLSAGERMQLINWDRELLRERELRRQSGHTGHPSGKSSLSAATQKSLERKRGMMIQKRAAGRTGHNTRLSREQPPVAKHGQLIANPQRVPKSTYSSRPR